MLKESHLGEMQNGRQRIKLENWPIPAAAPDAFDA